MNKSKPSWYGPLTMLIAAVLFATGGILCKLVPWSALAINGSRCLLGGLLIGLYLIATHHKLKFNAVVLFGAVCMCGLTTLFIYANKMTTAANAIILQYTMPVWIIILMWILFKKKPQKYDLITMAFVIAGILCFFFDSISKGDIAGDLIAVISGFFYAGLFLLNSFEKGDALSSLFFGQLGTGIIFTPLVFRETDFSLTPVVAVLLLGLFQVGLAYIFFNLGTKYTDPVTASLICGIEPVLNPILVAIFWGEKLTLLSLIGAVIVVAAILAYNIRKAKTNQNPSE